MELFFSPREFCSFSLTGCSANSIFFSFEEQTTPENGGVLVSSAFLGKNIAASCTALKWEVIFIQEKAQTSSCGESQREKHIFSEGSMEWPHFTTERACGHPKETTFGKLYRQRAEPKQTQIFLKGYLFDGRASGDSNFILDKIYSTSFPCSKVHDLTIFPEADLISLAPCSSPCL